MFSRRSFEGNDSRVLLILIVNFCFLIIYIDFPAREVGGSFQDVHGLIGTYFVDMFSRIPDSYLRLGVVVSFINILSWKL